MKQYPLVLLAAATFWVGCGPAEEESRLQPPTNAADFPEAAFKETAVTDARGVDAALAQQKETILATVERSMTGLDARIESIVNSAQQVDQDSQAKVQPTLDTLRDQRQELDALIGRMRQATGSAWHEVQRDFSAAYKSFLNTLEAAEEQLRG
jgi:uncharacterized protein YoxC